MALNNVNYKYKTMALKIIGKEDPLIKEHLNVLIYGYPGMGKTSLALTASNPILLDFDQGAERAVNRAETTIRISSWEDLLEAKRDKYLEGFGTIIIDTIGTALDDYCSEYGMRKESKNKKMGGGLSLSGYGAMKDEYKLFNDYCRMLGVNVISIAHLTEKGDDDFKLRPKVTGGTYDIVMSKTDLVGYMVTKNQKRTLSFQPIDSAIGKDSGNLGNLEIPGFEAPVFQTYMQDILNKTMEHINAKSKDAIEAQKEAENWKEAFDGVTDASTLNKLIKDAQKQKLKPLVSAIVKKAMGAKARELNLEFDTKAKQYVEPEVEAA